MFRAITLGNYMGVKRMKESEFQSKLIKKLKKRFEGCVVLKNDAGYLSNIPDLSVFYQDKWAMLEVKRSEREAHANTSHVRNQKYWIDILDDMSYASFIYPENEEEVLDELEQTFRP